MASLCWGGVCPSCVAAVPIEVNPPSSYDQALRPLGIVPRSSVVSGLALRCCLSIFGTRPQRLSMTKILVVDSISDKTVIPIPNLPSYVYIEPQPLPVLNDPLRLLSPLTCSNIAKYDNGTIQNATSRDVAVLLKLYSTITGGLHCPLYFYWRYDPPLYHLLVAVAFPICHVAFP